MEVAAIAIFKKAYLHSNTPSVSRARNSQPQYLSIHLIAQWFTPSGQPPTFRGEAPKYSFFGEVVIFNEKALLTYTV